MPSCGTCARWSKAMNSKPKLSSYSSQRISCATWTRGTSVDDMVMRALFVFQRPYSMDANKVFWQQMSNERKPAHSSFLAWRSWRSYVITIGFSGSWICGLLPSAGEKQHYALVLLKMLFQHLLPYFAISLLYDIGCQIHHSCMKWGFLELYLHWLTFGISVFHVFGHQWPCQVIYHPPKCKGFGFSDGEGCEQFWHSISKLIAYLWVCGVHYTVFWHSFGH